MLSYFLVTFANTPSTSSHPSFLTEALSARLFSLAAFLALTSANEGKSLSVKIPEITLGAAFCAFQGFGAVGAAAVVVTGAIEAIFFSLC